MNAVASGTPSRRLGSFEILREIGQGGMGVVYLARQPALERLVVLKKIRREMLVDHGIVERFQREARAAAAVHHHNVVSVYDCFEARGDHYIAQEFVDGRDLRSIVAQLGRLDPEVAALIALEVARGLEEIHAQGIVHRDLKPANILIGATGQVKIADFGIAVVSKADGLTRPGILVGSIPYMAPEQILGQRIDHRADIFLFGNLLFEMLTGSAPYQGPADESLESLLERMQGERYTPPRKTAPKTPRVLSRLVRGCLRARPAKRVASMSYLRRSLERTLGRPSTLDCRTEIGQYLWAQKIFTAADGRTAIRKAPAARSRIATRRHILWAASAVASVFLVMAGMAGYAQFARRGDPTGGRAKTVAPVPEISRPAPAAPAPPVVVPQVAPPEAAHVRFVADPWAEVTIDGSTRFFTPRAAPFELAPGSHRITLEHPTFGRTEIMLDLQAGETRTVRHVFAAGKPR